ncbi:MAG: 2-polyprenyl-6-methoxyphenol hydroxylase-like FAD-dependent oxidoreductase [Crocinitomix sp.]|jgi:2-polyprenyl-6-methoxyphenol hydroxylase-like FAD-dependent oxidoreductase
MFDLKIVIIGGGIAGLAAAIAFKRNKNKVVVREKNSVRNNLGMAFMIHSKTIDDINSVLECELDLKSSKINNFVLECSGNTQNSIKLNGWYVVKRIKLLKFLQSQLTHDEYYDNSDFSHLQYKEDKAIAAVFKDGSIEYGDLFIGADGINSKIRNLVCEAHFFPNEINELVCITQHKDENINDSTFRKYLSIKKGMAFGFIPISNNEHVWFLQFDSRLYGSIFQKSSEIENDMTSQFLSELPKKVSELIESSDLKKAHLWKNQELKLLPSFYKANVCLIGDAAHGSISLTSSGVSSGISSAIKLAQVLNSTEPLQSALNKYEKARKRDNAETIKYAQRLKLQFNSPPDGIENYYLPLFHSLNE